MPTKQETGIVAVEGGDLPYTLVLPEGEHGPGILLCYEIFGRSRHMLERAERLAGLGYVVMVPDFFWRLEPDLVVEETEPDGMQRAMGAAMRLDFGRAAEDGVRALQRLRELSQVRGGVGVFGYCLGGMIAYLIAALGQPDTAVLYYPSGVANHLDKAPDLRCPTLFEFGDRDQFLPPDVADQVRHATEGLEVIEIHVHPGADHAFDNELLPALHHGGAAAAAWEEAQAFLRRWLPTGQG